jgi:hypothetical protein
MSDKEKHIEEMAIIIAKQNCKPSGCENCDYAYEYGTKEESCEDYVSYRRMAEAFYNAGYRKHVEGEWKKTCVQDVFQCTNCKRPTKMDELCDSEILRAYCPNCGAKMKGGETDDRN